MDNLWPAMWIRRLLAHAIAAPRVVDALACSSCTVGSSTSADDPHPTPTLGPDVVGQVPDASTALGEAPVANPIASSSCTGLWVASNTALVSRITHRRTSSAASQTREEADGARLRLVTSQTSFCALPFTFSSTRRRCEWHAGWKCFLGFCLVCVRESHLALQSAFKNKKC